MTRAADFPLRCLFFLELVALGLPSLFYMAFLAFMALVGSVSGLLVCLGKVVGLKPELSGRDAVLLALLTAFGFLLSLGGFYAMGRFLRASLAYLRHGARGLTRADQRALIWAVAPLCVCLVLSVPALFRLEDDRWPAGLYMSGLCLMVPVGHLWLAWRRTGRG